MNKLCVFILFFIPALTFAQDWNSNYAKADSLYNAEKYEQSLGLTSNLIQQAKSQFGDPSIELQKALLLKASNLYDLDRYKEAISPFESSKKMLSVYQPESFDLAYLQHLLGRCYLKNNQIEKSKTELLDAGEIYEKTIGVENEFYVYLLSDILDVYRQQNDRATLLELLIVYAPLEEKVLGNQETTTGATYFELADLTFRITQNTYSAEIWALKSLEILEKYQISEVKTRLKCLQLLTEIYNEKGESYLVLPLIEEIEKLTAQLNLTAEERSNIAALNNYHIGVANFHLGYYKASIEKLNPIKDQLKRDNKVNAYYFLGRAYNASGNNEKALVNIDKATSLVASDNLLLKAKMLNEKGVVLQALSKHNQAIETYKQALDLVRYDDFNLRITIMANLAVLYSDLGEFDQAEQIYLGVLEITENDRTKSSIYISSLNNLGMLYMDWGEYSKCELLLNECLNLSAKYHGNKSVEYANATNNLGAFYFEVGNYDKSVDMFVQALEGYQITTGENSVQYSSVLNNIGLLFMEVEQYDEAKSYLEKAREIEKELIGEDHPDFAATLNNLSATYASLNDYSNAEQYQKAAMNIINKHFGEKHPDYAQYLMNLGMLEVKMGKSERAVQTLRKSLGIHKEIYGKKHPNTAIAEYQLARQLGKDKTEEAITLFKSSIGTLQNHLNNFLPFLSEKEKSGFYDRYVKYFHGFFEFSEYASKKDPSIQAMAYDLSLSLKGMLLRSSRAMRNIVLNSGNQELINLYDKWVSEKKRIAELSALPVEQRSADLDALINEANAYEKKLFQMSDELGHSQLKETSWQEVKEKLKENEAAIEFVTYKKEDTKEIKYMALILKKDFEYPQLISLFEEKQLTDIINIYGSNNYDYIKNIYNYSEEKKTPLYDLIWKPLESTLDSTDKVFVSAAGLLHRVSLYAIATDKNKYLIDAYELISLNSTGDIMNYQGIESYDMNNIALMGGINYDSKESDKVVWDYLPGSKEEVESINASLEKKNKNVDFTSADNATETHFKEVAESSDIVHVATHGFFFPDPQKIWEVFESEETDDDEGDVVEFRGSSNVVGVTSFTKNKNPLMRSGLVFAGVHDLWSGVESIKQDDGVLTAMEVSQMNLTNTKLAVLSACETGLGEIVGDEGVYGLKRTFKIAGVKYLIISLWQVPDKETKEFMMTFYDKLFSDIHVTVDEAFEFAQREMRKKYDPYFWAAFVLIR
ncbi:CHAT domain-containing protein [Paracrocinitomix mangrovi]|uniref:CHAT domain-containing tetratricopeptide repeat protein n=1 Tax=Paracrocinitomix mangrovi TaxID=2862509 RepID=UPI001C8D38D4|nr:CHAT domain-containing protein [Paracrocinitomix mangrovi]UKN02134.1 CHAT domain-containing protein [Paracrocinitomix mangrovi]